MIRYLSVIILVAFLNIASANDQVTTESLRLVSYSPHATEMIFELGAGDQLYGVTEYCIFPPEAQEKTIIGGYLNPNTERILALQPDIIFQVPGASPIESIMTSANIDVISVPNQTLDDISKGLHVIGDRIGRSEVADDKVRQFEEALQEIEAVNDPNIQPTVLLIIGRAPGPVRNLFSCGPGTFMDEVITVAGGTNWIKKSPALYPTVSVESLIANPPDVIIETRETEFVVDDEMLQESIQQWAKALGPRAKNKTRILFVSDKHLTIPGPGIIDSIHHIQELLKNDQSGIID